MSGYDVWVEALAGNKELYKSRLFTRSNTSVVEYNILGRKKPSGIRKIISCKKFEGLA